MQSSGEKVAEKTPSQTKRNPTNKAKARTVAYPDRKYVYFELKVHTQTEYEN